MYVFLTVKNDSMFMKEATIYAISLICGEKNLYIEINSPSASPNIPVEIFKEMIGTSYFMGVNNQDIEIPIMIDENESKINMFTSNLEGCKEKFKNFLKECLDEYSDNESEKIKFVVENPFDWVFFINTFFDFTTEGSPIFFDKICPEPIIIQSLNALSKDNAELEYYDLKNMILSKQTENIKTLENSEEELFKFNKMRIFSENIFMKEYFENIS